MINYYAGHKLFDKFSQLLCNFRQTIVISATYFSLAFFDLQTKYFYSTTMNLYAHKFVVSSLCCSDNNNSINKTIRMKNFCKSSMKNKKAIKIKFMTSKPFARKAAQGWRVWARGVSQRTHKHTYIYTYICMYIQALLCRCELKGYKKLNVAVSNFYFRKYGDGHVHMKLFRDAGNIADTHKLLHTYIHIPHTY